ncbi:hypothetical protein TrLO_g9006 [Triparma laevis f. longispina]|uniref:C2H2-type domain-containing protein n=1 Tax=Triparma laevis f. longispina TaxID=1714387 RepID=A0A9W7FEK9_9STRA|nr:hypothetical protein TrLO_g9006 [Triparma laevis f. longispina]
MFNMASPPLGDTPLPLSLFFENTRLDTDSLFIRPKRSHLFSNLPRDKLGRIIRDCPIIGCGYKADISSMKSHKAAKHNIGVVWHKCDIKGCDFQSKQAGNVKTHKANVHDINVTWHHCPQPNCEFKAKQKEKVKFHLANIHSIGVTWHPCPIISCEFKAKRVCDLKMHRQKVHERPPPPLYSDPADLILCPVPGCDYKAKQPQHLERHRYYTHNPDRPKLPPRPKDPNPKPPNQTWYCNLGEGDCDFKTSREGELTKHKQNIHGVKVVKWHHCNIPNCAYKAKKLCVVKTHKQFKHSINVKWFPCDQVNCVYRAKQSGDLKQHKRDIHNIGVIWCSCLAPGCNFKGKTKRHLDKHMFTCHTVSFPPHPNNIEKLGWGFETTPPPTPSALEPPMKDQVFEDVFNHQIFEEEVMKGVGAVHALQALKANS